MGRPLGERRVPRPAGWLRAARRLIPALVIAAGLALAPAAHAQPAANSTYGPVQRDDTLWDLAIRFKGDAPVNSQQAMIAILRANPRAFGQGNINALRTGVTLRVPTVQDMTAITPGEAAAEFARHEQAWRTRRETGSATPAPGPGAPPRPAPTPSAGGARGGGGDDAAEELREARAEVTKMRNRLAERDKAIEDLLAQLAAAQRELQAMRAGALPAGEAAGSDAQARGNWLPVSPLILGSSLIVLLVLIVVVTLLRQRESMEEAQAAQTPDAEGEEPGAREEAEEPDLGEDAEVRDPDHRKGGREVLPADGGDPLDGARRGPAEPARRGAAAGAAAVSAVESGVGSADEELAPDEGPAPDEGLAPDHEVAEFPEDESDDLPIGMDLEGDEDWDVGPDEPFEVGPEPVEEAGHPSGFTRHIEVGELDELDLDADPAPDSVPDLSADLEEEPEPETDARSGRRE